MIQVRKADERGIIDHGWLEARHSFSFGYYDDPRYRGYRDLLVLNEDRIGAGEGFGLHPHHNMEIVTYLIEGKLGHHDSMGNGSTLERGDVQRMSAGTGVKHSEVNGSPDDPLHLIQIWITPEKDGIQPDYEEKRFTAEDKRNRLLPIVSPDGRDGSLTIHQDAKILASVLEAGKTLTHTLADGRHGWIQLVGGEIELNGERLTAGDGAAIAELGALEITAKAEAELLLFDLR